MASLSPKDDEQPNFRRQGSIRKVLPSVPDMDTRLSMAAKMINRRTSSPRGSHCYGPFFLEYSLLAEYGLFEKQKLPGIYVIPAAKSPIVWFGVMFVRQGLYQGGVFRFTVHIPETYPDGDCPGLVFDQPIFHPQIQPETGALDVRKGFLKWRRNVNHIWHLLLYARRIFYKIDPSDPSNPEAAQMYKDDIETFRARVSDCVQQSMDKLYEPPPNADDLHSIRFWHWNPEVHGALREKLFGSRESGSTRPSMSQTGLSWVQKGSLQIFSKDVMMS